MSLDVWLTCDCCYGKLYSFNITHNLGRMADEAGDLYYAMWRPDERGWAKAGDVVAPLEDGLARLRARPADFKKLNPANGWGDYEGLVSVAQGYLEACRTWPDARIEVSR